MARSKLDILPGQILEVEFETMALGGRAKGTPVGFAHGQCAVFCQYATVGDLAKVRVTRVVKRYVEGDVVEILRPGKGRVEPPCPYFEDCGGCNWQHMDYDLQLSQKAEIVQYVLARNGIRTKDRIVCEPSDAPIHYRSRADATFEKRGGKYVGGFLHARSHDLLDIDRCLLLTPSLASAFPEFKKALLYLMPELREDYPFKIRILQDPNSDALYARPNNTDMEGEGFLGTYLLNDGRLVDAAHHVLAFEVDGLTIEYDPSCFTQVNLATNEKLVRYAIDCLSPQKNEDILELYAGIGNFTMPLAKRAGSVTAVEASPISSRFSKSNANLNGLINIDHIHRNSEKACAILKKQGRTFDKALVDPPRTGMGAETVNALCDLEPETVVFVSCHPDTLAKDLLRFEFRGYRAESIRGFDMFGQTFHVETVTVLKRV